jgi:kynurenine formamidase
VQQVQILARHHDAPAIAKKLGRTRRSVDSAALRHGISFTKMRAWTKDEDTILREQANKMLLRRLAKKLKRTEDVVKRRAKELGLSLRKSGAQASPVTCFCACLRRFSTKQRENTTTNKKNKNKALGLFLPP